MKWAAVVPEREVIMTAQKEGLLTSALDERAAPSAPASRNLPDGLYGVTFRVQAKQASGVVVIQGHKFSGGDSGMAYFGTFSEQGAHLSAHVTTLRHTQTGGVALLGADNMEFTAEGRSTSNGAHFSGTARHSGKRFEFTLTKLPTPAFSA